LLRVQELVATIAFPCVALFEHDLNIRWQRAAEQGSIPREIWQRRGCAKIAQLPQSYRHSAQRHQHAHDRP
jgi:hypothetical protein